MTDDDNKGNIVDITGQLPPPDLHTRWQKRLPDYYLRRLVELKAHYEDLSKLMQRLKALRGELVDHNNRAPLPEGVSKRQALWAEEHIADALVLLKHACDELMDAMPTELFISRRDLRDVEMDWEKGRSP